jgi:GT2 family glycosyltransferase
MVKTAAAKPVYTELQLDLYSSQPVDLAPKYKFKKAAIVIPVYGAFDFVERLLSSIYQCCDIDFDVICIDDKSPDPRIKTLFESYKARHANFIFLENDTNQGFVKTVNRGISAAGDLDVVIVNTDVQVPDKWLSRMLHPIWSQPKVASVTPNV